MTANDKNAAPNMLDEALAYLRRGRSIIPIHLSQKGDKCEKKPLINWIEYQKRLPTEDEVREWWRRWPSEGIALVTGKLSGVVVVDVEKGGPTDGLTPTVISKTGGGGFHYLYRQPEAPIKNSVKSVAELTDVRGEGGLIVLPPSMHGSGNRYEWLISPDMSDLAELPQWILEKSRDTKGEAPRVDWEVLAASEVPAGGRNATAAQYIGKLLHDLSPELWETVGWPAAQAWNAQHCKPPLDTKELRSVFDSIAGREAASRAKKAKPEGEQDTTQAGQLVRYVTEDTSALLFHDELGIPYVRLTVGNHKETWGCNSTQFKLWLAKKYYVTARKPIASGTIETAVEVLRGIALFDGPKHTLSARIARADDTVWYDLCDTQWRAVRITAAGWSIETDPPPVFRRYSHQAAQVEPVEGGSVADLLPFLNLQSDDQKILFLVCVVAFFIPGFPHPILYIYGPQGSAKSTNSKSVRTLTDPSKIEVVSMPKDEEQLVQQLSHHHTLFFDNVSKISDAISDLLCRAVTGSGFSKRKLYTDDEDVIYTLLANIGINGIELVPSKPDLLERSVLIELWRIAKGERRQLHELEADFERELPRLLGAIFTAVSKALALYPSVHVDELPRMADFTQWGCAIAEALGYTQQEFLDAYRRNIGQQNDAVIGDHIEAAIIMEFMSDKGVWTGSASALLAALKESNPANVGELPKQANVFSRNLFALKTNLEEVGLQLSRSNGSKRTITIRNLNVPETVAPQSDPDWFEGLDSTQSDTGDISDILPTTDTLL